uniref:Small cell adhesion glycoprotein n=1 Tax=Canis lupus dingo TaxID=286419 RepID=A0A8C0JQS6_CANLU
WLSSLALPSTQGVILETQDRVPRQAPCVEPASPSACISASLSLSLFVILIFFYLYKNKGSYVTYEPAEGEPSAILQMESDSAKGRDKEEYFI